MTLSELLSTAVEYLYGYWPIRIVHDWESAARVRAGRVTKLLTSKNGMRGYGVHFFWPALEEIHVADGSIGVFTTAAQTCMTRDGKTVSFKMAVRYHVADYSKMLATIWQSDDTIATEVMRSAGELVSTLSVKEGREGLADEVYRDVFARLEEWGLELEAITLISFSPCTVLRLIGDPSVFQQA